MTDKFISIPLDEEEISDLTMDMRHARARAIELICASATREDNTEAARCLDQAIRWLRMEIRVLR